MTKLRVLVLCLSYFTDSSDSRFDCFACRYSESMGFPQENPELVSSLRLDYYLGLG